MLLLSNKGLKNGKQAHLSTQVQGVQVNPADILALALQREFCKRNPVRFKMHESDLIAKALIQEVSDLRSRSSIQAPKIIIIIFLSLCCPCLLEQGYNLNDPSRSLSVLFSTLGLETSTRVLKFQHSVLVTYLRLISKEVSQTLIKFADRDDVPVWAGEEALGSQGQELPPDHLTVFPHFLNSPSESGNLAKQTSLKHASF